MVSRIPLVRTRGLRQAVLRRHQSGAELAEHEPAGAFAVGAFAGDELISVGFIGRDPDGRDSWRVRGMATEPHARGRGAGAAVLQALLGHAQAQKAQRVWCNARIPALSLYQRAGFTPISGRFELPEIGPHVVMEWRPPASEPQRASTGASRMRDKGLNPSRS